MALAPFVMHATPETSSSPPPRPVKIILDTDMGNDVDDALALAVIHSLQTRGACELLAVTHTTPLPGAAPYTVAINTFYGRPDIPVGITPDAPRAEKTSKYLPVASKRDADGRLLYPAKFDAATAPKSIDLLRRTLAAAADGEVVIVQVGFSTNLARLLDTSADAISPLTGLELVRKKVRLLSIMAGCFAPVPVLSPDAPIIEYNVKWDIPAARKLAAKWPTPVWWSSFELGWAVRYPAWSIDRDFDYMPHHIIKDSYQAYRATPHERPCWDLTSVIAAVLPDRGYFDQVKGLVSIDEKGISTFAPDERGRDVMLKVNQEQSARLRELLVALTSEPPRR